MALIFPRLAQNYMKRGYYPTDSATLDAICGALATDADRLRAADPCCGEGSALLHLVEHLQSYGGQVEPFGIEVDDERAWRAKEILASAGGYVAHGDMHDVVVTKAAMDFLFLNPPYGDVVSDGAALGGGRSGDRHEKIFCRRWFSHLQVGGVIALVIPYYVFDEEMATLVARHFDRVEVFLAPEQQFKQSILLGIKKRPGHAHADVVKRLMSFAAGDGQQQMPTPWPHEPYMVPASSQTDFAFSLARLDPRQLEDELGKGMMPSTLWPKFRNVFGGGVSSVARRPLCGLSSWHLALALAAGQISGIVRNDNRVMLVKGGTHKAKAISKEYEERADGSIAETTIAIDKFVPLIKAIDFTPGADYGKVFTVR